MNVHVKALLSMISLLVILIVIILLFVFLPPYIIIGIIFTGCIFGLYMSMVDHHSGR